MHDLLLCPSSKKYLKNHNNSQLHLANASISIVNTKFVALNLIDSPKELMQHQEILQCIWSAHIIVKNITCREEERSYTYSFKNGRDLMPNNPSLRMTHTLKEQSLRIRSLPLLKQKKSLYILHPVVILACILRFYDNVAATTRYFLEFQEPLVCFPRYHIPILTITTQTFKL